MDLLEEMRECTRVRNLFAEGLLKKAFFSYGSGIPKRTQKIKLQIQCNIIRNTFQ